MVEKTVAFGEIDDVDSDGVDKLTGVFHSEVEPLQVADTVCVIPHPHVESGLILDSDLVEIGTFKVSIKSELRGATSVSTIELSYYNPHEDNPLECTYLLPMEKNTVLIKFEA